MRSIDVGLWRVVRSALHGVVILLLLGSAGRGAAQSFGTSEHAVAPALPGCSTTNPEVRIIDSVDDWATVNDPGARIFCVLPGWYDPAGPILLERSGAAGRPRILRHYDPTDATPPHPVRNQTTRLARISGLEIRANHWVIHGLAVRGGDATAVTVRDASDNVLDRLLVEDAPGRLLWLRGASHRNVVQNSVLRRARVGLDSDWVCIIVGDPGSLDQHDNRIVQNEIYDCTDGIQLYHPMEATAGRRYPGLVIEENDIYLTRARYTDCRGSFDPAGPCGCAENGIDAKIGGTGASQGQMVSIRRNRIWGWRETDHGPNGDDRNRCGGTGSPGDLVILHNRARYVEIRDNILFDGPRGVALGKGAARAVVSGNVLHALDKGVGDQGVSVFVGGPYHEIRGNLFSDGEVWLDFAETGTKRTKIECNTVLAAHRSAGGPGRESTTDYNAYYGSAPAKLAGAHDVVADGSQAPASSLCFWRKRWTTPERLCIAHGTYQVEPAHLAVCQETSSSAASLRPSRPLLLLD